MPLPLLKHFRSSSPMLVIFPSLPIMVLAMMGRYSRPPVNVLVFPCHQPFLSWIPYRWHVCSYPPKHHTVLARLQNAMAVLDKMLIGQMPMLRCSQVSCMAWKAKYSKAQVVQPSTHSCAVHMIPG